MKIFLKSTMLRKTQFLYNYFAHNNETDGISFNRIKRALEGMEVNADEAFKNKYVPLYNLIRYGLVELIGKNKYGLSPSILLAGIDYSLGINFPKINTDSMNENHLGLTVLENSLHHLENEVTNSFDLHTALSVVPRIQNIIRSSFVEWTDGFENATFIESFTNYGWKHAKIMKGTFFRVRFGSNQQLFTYIVKQGSNKYFQFERAEFEKFNLALMMHSINEFPQIKNLEYDASKQTLHIKAFGFPLILERLLFINHILKTGKISLIQEYYLSTADFKYLNKIFHYKINKL